MTKKKQKFIELKDWVFRTFIGIFVFALIYGSITYTNHIGTFQYKNIIVKGNKFVKTEQVLEKINIPENANLFSINLLEIQDQINHLEFVNFANVSRTFPSSICVNITERKPIAYFESENKLTVIDETGEILSFNDKVGEYYRLPVITGELLSTQEGMNPESNLLNIFNLVKYINSEYKTFYTNLTKIEVKDNLITMTSGYFRTNIYLDFTKPYNQIAILKEFENTIQEHRDLTDYQYIDLRVPGQVIVKERRARQS